MLSNKNSSKQKSYKHKHYGGPSSIFVKHLSTDTLTADLTMLYARLVDLGVDCGVENVYLADLEESDSG